MYDPVRHFELLNEKDLQLELLMTLRDKIDNEESRRTRRKILLTYKEEFNKYLRILDEIDSV